MLQPTPYRTTLSFITRKLAMLGIVCTVIAAPAVIMPASNSVRAAEDDKDAVPPHVERAVDRALQWLADHQNKDGSWSEPGRGGAVSTAVTGLAAKAFLARGHIPGQGKFGETLNKAIRYVLSRQQQDGLIASNGAGNAAMYEHGIACAMLGEAFGMVDDQTKRDIREALKK